MTGNVNKMSRPEDYEKELIKRAFEAREYAYAPYSHFAVGAALLSKEGKIYCGSNIENASFGATNCAERTAFYKAVSEGEREFAAIAVCGGKEGKEGKEPSEEVFPCGICRQVMAEFCGPDFLILMAKNKEEYRKFTLEELLPESFSL